MARFQAKGGEAAVRIGLVAAALLLGGCAPDENGLDGRALFGAGESATLYRNSPIARELRIHWATFDASDGIDYNLSNCQMAARLLNANVAASAEAEGKQPHTSVGFWCEVDGFAETGGVPIQFDAAFPTDTMGPMRFTQ